MASAGKSGTPKNARAEIRQRRTRRTAITLNVGTAVVLAFLLGAMVNYLASREYFRKDISRTQPNALSRKTQNLLDHVTNNVNVTVFIAPEHAWFRDVRQLLKEYTYANPLIKVNYLDPHRDLAQTEALAARYGMEIGDDLVDTLVFDHLGRVSTLAVDDLVDTDMTPVFHGGDPRPVRFVGEEKISSTILSITIAARPVVYMLYGHGERDPTDFGQYSGFSEIAQAMEADGFIIKRLVLAELQEVPRDADALLLAGPQRKIPQPELDILRGYLEGNGKVLLLLDAGVDTGLEPLLRDWGIELRDDVVVDVERTFSGQELFVTEYGLHPVGQAVRGITSIFYLPRSVRALTDVAVSASDRPKVTELAHSSDAGWAETSLDDPPMEYNEGVDQPGPVAVAAAAERGPVEGIEVQLTPTRLVVFGDSDFVANGAMAGGNQDFFLSALNWLAERDAALGIAPRPVNEVRLVVSSRQLKLLFLAVVIGLPGAVGVLGFLVWLVRRK